MLISIVLLAAASVAAATPSAAVSPAPLAGRVMVTAVTVQPAWRAVRADTIGDLLFTTETLNGRVRFVARGLKGAAPVTTTDFAPDSVRAWTAAAAALASSGAPKMGDMRGLGVALTLNVTTADAGQPAFGFYVGDAVTDQQVALALTKESVAKLTSDVNDALDLLGK